MLQLACLLLLQIKTIQIKSRFIYTAYFRHGMQHNVVYRGEKNESKAMKIKAEIFTAQQT